MVSAVVDQEQALNTMAHVTFWHMVYSGATDVLDDDNRPWDMLYHERLRLEKLRDDLWTEADRDQLRKLALGHLQRDLLLWFRRCKDEIGYFAALGAVRELMVYGIGPIEDASEEAAEGWNYLEDAYSHVPVEPIREVLQESLARWSSDLREHWATNRV